MKHNFEIVSWFSIWLEDPESTEKSADFQSFLKVDDNRKEFELLLKNYKKARKIILSYRIQEDDAWNSTLNKVERKRRFQKIYRVSSVAVAAIALLLVAIILCFPENKKNTNLLAQESASLQAIIRTDAGEEFSISNNDEKQVSQVSGIEIWVDQDKNIRYHINDSSAVISKMNTLSIPRGGFYSIVLSDGTKIKLNAASQLTYPIVFTEKERVVYLMGEAYFEVTANLDAPFRVVCGQREVVVTGTKFNVSTYQNEMYATLTEGKVSVSNGQQIQKLKPGEQAKVSDDHIEIYSVDTSLYTSWVNGMFAFDNARLEDIVHTLSSWYDVNFQFLNPHLKELTFTFSAPRDENLLFIVKLLENVSNARFKSGDNTIEIFENQ